MDHLLKHTWVSIDIETLDTTQNSTIVAVGACLFTINNGVFDTFSVNVSPASCKTYGLTVSKDTLAWWAKQPKEVRMAWQTNQQTLPDALSQFGSWLSTCKQCKILTNGLSFDLGILRNAYEKSGIEVPWKYTNEVDLRTISLLVDSKLSIGNDHVALKDAVNQAEQFIALFKD